MNSAIGLITALPAEARALFEPGHWQRQEGQVFRHVLLKNGTALIAVRSGMGFENALAAGRWLIKRKVAALGVLGVSGGLDPGLESGDLVIADSVIQQKGDTFEQVWEGNLKFVETTYAALITEKIPTYRGAILTVQKPALSARHKETLFAQTRALAVDMESAATALVAREAGLPFFALRTVCDAATRSIPDDLFNCINQKGHIRIFHILRMLLIDPAIISDLMLTKRDFALATAALRRAWHKQISSSLPALLKPNPDKPEKKRPLASVQSPEPSG